MKKDYRTKQLLKSLGPSVTNSIWNLATTILSLTNPNAAVVSKLLKEAHHIHAMRDLIFWKKMEIFLSSINFPEVDRLKFARKLAENEDNEEFLTQLYDAIDKCSSKKLMKYLSNATRCYASNYIDIHTYYRICHIISSTLPEDLQFIIDHITDPPTTEFPYSITIQNLQNTGLIMVKDLYINGTQKYQFTPWARIIDQYALSYNDVNRYPNPVHLPNYNTFDPLPITTPQYLSSLSQNNQLSDQSNIKALYQNQIMNLLQLNDRHIGASLPTTCCKSGDIFFNVQDQQMYIYSAKDASWLPIIQHPEGIISSYDFSADYGWCAFRDDWRLIIQWMPIEVKPFDNSNHLYVYPIAFRHQVLSSVIYPPNCPVQVRLHQVNLELILPKEKKFTGKFWILLLGQ